MTEQLKNEQVYVVAIGVSAGGLEAIQEFFSNTAEYSQVAFIVIQHLSPEHKSMLVELLGKNTRMHVYEAEHDLLVKESCVYVIPNDKLMTISSGRLQLEDKPADKLPNLAIDHFMHALAFDKKEKAIAVILSGTGMDGTKGIHSIKEAGGLVLVQEPDTAAFNGMPVSAIGSGCTDFILPPRAMPEEIYMYMKEAALKIMPFGKTEERLLKKIEEQVLKHTGSDISLYKSSTVLRRITQRMLMLDIHSLADYELYLHDHSDEILYLYNALLINATRFFRDMPAFDMLYNKVFPSIFAALEKDEPIKIWVCACSTGEEAYSIAILLDKYLSDHNTQADVKIFATDADNSAVQIAARGVFQPEALTDLPAAFADRYFSEDGSQYTIIPRIRKQIVFARHNVFKDPPFIKNHLVTCRNMLIYMNNPVQKKILETFHFALKQNGFLFLGTSENINPVKEYMEEISFQWKIYKKVKSRQLSFALPYDSQQERSRQRNKQVNQYDQANYQEKDRNSLSEDFRDALAEDFGFAGLYIDRNFHIREAIGNYKRYLSLTENRLDLSILKMAPPDLSQALHTAVSKSWQEGRKVHMKNVEVADGQQTRRVSITVKPALRESDEYTLITLGEAEQNDTGIFDQNATEAVVVNSKKNNDVYLLEMELAEMQNKLQSTLENYESSSEELQSTNEELLSSIEELQSLNEELHTLNGEHQVKIRELVELNDDLNNYFKSSDIGQLFVDAEMRIRKFNPASTRLINILEADVGRHISQLSTNFRDARISADIQQVVNGGAAMEKEIVLMNDNSCLVRILPYIRQDKQTDGAVITFIDITAIKYLNSILSGTFDSSLSAIMAFSIVRNRENAIIDFVLTAANYASDALLNRHHEAAMRLSMQQEFKHLGRDGFFERYRDVVENNSVLHMEGNFHPSNPDLYYEVVAVKTPYGISITFTDITDKKDAEVRLHKNYNELLIAKEYLKRLNTLMEDQVMERTKDLSDKEERFRMVAKATNDTFWDWDLANNTMWWSDNFTLVFGYGQAAETQSRTFWLDHIHADDRQRVKESIFRAINSSKEQWSAEYRFSKADGSYAEVLDRGYILKDEYQTPYRMLGSMLDVTNLKRAEAEISATNAQKNFLAQAMPLSVWTASRDGKITFLNTQFSRYTGIKSDEINNSDWRAIVHPADLKELTTVWKTAQQNNSDFAVEIRIKRKDNSYRWQLVRAKARIETDNHLSFWVGTSTDIHEQKMATETMEQQVIERTEALQHTNRQLEESNYELQQYAYVASHDLKEPIRKINMFGNILKTKFLHDQDEKVQDFMDRIIKSSTRMMRLIDDLLNFSNLSFTDLFEETDLNKIFQDILSDLELSVQEKNAVINIDPLPVIKAVPAQIRQVFQNLVSNALKFSNPDTQPVIQVTAEFTAEKSLTADSAASGPFVRVSVQDNGIGFDEAYLNKIFTLFQRLHSKEFEGTGIGLAVAHKIVSKHNGLISARSQENHGSTFIVVLPVNQE